MRTVVRHLQFLALAVGSTLAILTGCGQGAPGGAQVPAVAVEPTEARLPPFGTEGFSATVTGLTVTSVQWTVTEGAGGGSVTASGLYTAPGSPGTYHVVVTSQADSTKFATATVTVTTAAGVSVSVSPASITIPASGTQQFAATVTGNSNTSVTWNLREGATCGSLSSSGFYTAPAASATCHVDATSAADATKTGSATVTVAGGAGTNVQAGALSTQTWTVAGSPYRIFGDVHIPSGSRLTIQQGVQVRFQGHYRLEGPGVIDARGTSPSQRDILFTAENCTTGWYGIRIWNGTGSYTAPPDVSDYHLENMIIECVVKDRSNPRSFADATYNDSRGALYVFGATTYGTSCPESYCGLKQSDLHLNGLMLRHNRAMSTSTPPGAAAGIYFNSLNGSVHPTWTDVVFDDNQSESYGAAFTQHHAGPITFKNCTFSNGTALVPDEGGNPQSGSIGYWDVSGPVTLDTCTLTNNSPAAFATAGAPSVVLVNTP